jgi:hypothetical protein
MRIFLCWVLHWQLHCQSYWLEAQCHLCTQYKIPSCPRIGDSSHGSNIRGNGAIKTGSQK